MAQQDKHEGDRLRLFSAVASAVDAMTVFYAGCYVDLAPSFVFDSVTYLDMDKRTPKFFADTAGILELIARHNGPWAARCS